MISTTTLMLILLLVVGLALAIWHFAITYRFKMHMSDYSYTRGANVEEGGKVELKCDGDHKICVYRATEICSKPNHLNFETTRYEPIDVSPGNYGDFDPKNTTDITGFLQAHVGEDSTSYTFTYNNEWRTGIIKGVGTPPQLSCDGKRQLIATYTCVPRHQECKHWTPKKPNVEGYNDVNSFVTWLGGGE